MSVRCIGQVLESSRHAGTELLMLVVLADYSDDEGNSYLAVASLARKCRMSSRNANYILTALQAGGELRVLKNEGPKGTNRYRIMLALLGAKPLKPTSPLKPASGEPSLNRQEPSCTPPTRRFELPAIPNCPHRQLIALFAERLPELPRPKAELWDGKNAEAMRARWKRVLTAKRETGERYANTEAEALAWFAKFFDRVAASDFLTGRDDKWRGCNLAWLLKHANFTKVVEGNYMNRATA